MLKTLTILFVSAVLLSGCSQKNSFSISGSFKGEGKKYIYLDRVDVNKSVTIDSAKIGGNGRFHLSIKCKEPDYYQLGFSSTEFINLLAAPGEKIKLAFEADTIITNYHITGSVGSSQIKTLDSALLVTRSKLESLRAEYEKITGSPDFDVKGPELDKEFSDLVVAQRRYNIAFILDNMTSLASIKALYQKISDDAYVLYDPRDLQFLKIVRDTLKVYYPESRHTIALNEYFEKELNAFYLDQITQEAMNKPTVMLDPSLPDVNGKKVALSSLKGKYVLLSFWSIESQDCFTVNTQLKELYKNYRSKGFEIYQISLDADDASWKAAVKFEELPWISVREDNTSEISNAVIYNVQAIPANYLYNKNGEIIGKDLYGTPLKLKLEQLLGK